MAGSVIADLIGGHHERLVLDRPGADQDLPVGLARDLRERRGKREHTRAADRQDPEQLREAEVVADRQPEREALRRLGQDDLVARLLGRRLPVLGPPDDDVEHVDLAVDRSDLAVGADVHRSVRQLLAIGAALGDRAGDEIDAELARCRARPGNAAAVERLRARQQLLVATEHVELLGQNDELGAVGRGGAGEAVGAVEVALGVRRRVELNRRCPHLSASPSGPSIAVGVPPFDDRPAVD